MITELLHYKIAYKLKILLKNKNHSNLIIYGKQGSGKTTLIKDIFSVNGKKYNNGNFYLILTKNYYYFDCKSIKDKTSFINYQYESKYLYFFINFVEKIKKSPTATTINFLKILILKLNYLKIMYCILSAQHV